MTDLLRGITPRETRAKSRQKDAQSPSWRSPIEIKQPGSVSSVWMCVELGHSGRLRTSAFTIRPCFDFSGFISFEIKAGRLEVATPRFTFRLCRCPSLCDLGVLCLCLGCLGFISDTKCEVCCSLRVRGELSEMPRRDVERTGKQLGEPVLCFPKDCQYQESGSFCLLVLLPF